MSKSHAITRRNSVDNPDVPLQDPEWQGRPYLASVTVTEKAFFHLALQHGKKGN